MDRDLSATLRNEADWVSSQVSPSPSSPDPDMLTAAADEIDRLQAVVRGRGADLPRDRRGMSTYDRETAVIAAIGRAFNWPGRVGEFLGCWAIACIATWIIGLPLFLAIGLAAVFGSDPANFSAWWLVPGNLLAGLIVLAAFWWSERRWR